MFTTFLNKEDRHLLDLSVFIKYSPEELLFYYYNSCINMTLETYLEMKEWLGNCYGNPDNLIKWLDFMGQEIDAVQDLESMHESEYLNYIGPYYYVPTNTQFHIMRFNPIEHNPLTSADFDALFSLHKLPSADRPLHKYSQSRKTVKKAARSKDELIRDICMCAASLRKIENLNQYILYINKFLERRKAICNAAEICPPEPAPVPEKPQKPADAPAKLKLLDTIGIARRWPHNKPAYCADYNRKMKIYFIKCREHEKACERFKKARQDWGEYRESFLKKCQFDIKEASSVLKEILALQSVYKDVIRKSFIHPDYQEVDILNRFQRYLETGRADNLQGCMNIYEGERHWIDIKAGQERIENTIHYLQPENEALKLANQEIGRLIASTMD